MVYLTAVLQLYTESECISRLRNGYPFIGFRIQKPIHGYLVTGAGFRHIENLSSGYPLGYQESIELPRTR